MIITMAYHSAAWDTKFNGNASSVPTTGKDAENIETMVIIKRTAMKTPIIINISRNDAGFLNMKITVCFRLLNGLGLLNAIYPNP